jgi:hypothetical protein
MLEEVFSICLYFVLTKFDVTIFTESQHVLKLLAPFVCHL